MRMIFNFWRRYPRWKPKKSGWYQCTVRYGYERPDPCVMDLYFRSGDGKWIDRRRQHVFEGYKVYKSGREPMEYNRVYTDSLCERIDILAWRPLPRIYRRGFKDE